MKEWLDLFMGLDHGETVGDQRRKERQCTGNSKAATVMRRKSVRCISSDSGRPRDDQRFRRLHQPVRLTVDHNGYHGKVAVPGSMREEWLADLAS